MTKEEFNNLWKNCTREEILLQFYYDYTELQERINIIKEVREYGENCINNLLSNEQVENPYKFSLYLALEIHKKYLAILDKENK